MITDEARRRFVTDRGYEIIQYAGFDDAPRNLRHILRDAQAHGFYAINRDTRDLIHLPDVDMPVDHDLLVASYYRLAWREAFMILVYRELLDRGYLFGRLLSEGPFVEGDDNIISMLNNMRRAYVPGYYAFKDYGQSAMYPLPVGPFTVPLDMFESLAVAEGLVEVSSDPLVSIHARLKELVEEIGNIISG